jgi:hypothetical protein
MIRIPGGTLSVSLTRITAGVNVTPRGVRSPDCSVQQQLPKLTHKRIVLIPTFMLHVITISVIYKTETMFLEVDEAYVNPSSNFQTVL